MKHKNSATDTVIKDLDLPKEWLHITQDYSLLEHLGQGSYGQVVKAACKVTGETVAVKGIFDITDNEYDWVKIIREIQIMEQLTKF